MMKRAVLSIILVFFLAFGFADAFAQSHKDVTAAPACKYCGMDRGQFAFSRVLLEYDDGSTLGACSIHCAAVDLALHIDKTPVSMKVADLGTQELVEAEQATWVLGGDRPGVMTRRAKWAFKERSDAEKFVKDHGGELVSFDEAMKATYEDMYSDTKMIREKRKMKRMSAPEQKKP